MMFNNMNIFLLYIELNYRKFRNTLAWLVVIPAPADRVARGQRSNLVTGLPGKRGLRYFVASNFCNIIIL